MRTFLRRVGWVGAVIIAASIGLTIYQDRPQHHDTNPDDVAAIIHADYCDSSGYQVISRLDGSKETIYDCTTGLREQCVTYSNGIASNQTNMVRILFADTLGTSKPSCIGG